MVIKMIALGIFGSKCYLGDTWNRLDFFIVMAGWVIPPFFSLVTHALNHYHHGKAGQKGLATRFTGRQLGNRDFPVLWSPCYLKWPLNWQEWWTRQDFSFKTSFLSLSSCKIDRKKGYRYWPLLSDACGMFPLLCFLQDDGVFTGRS